MIRCISGNDSYKVGPYQEVGEHNSIYRGYNQLQLYTHL